MGDGLCPRGHPSEERARSCVTCGELFPFATGAAEEVSPPGPAAAASIAAPLRTTATGGVANDDATHPPGEDL